MVGPPPKPIPYPTTHTPKPHKSKVDALWRRVRHDVLEPLEAALARFDPKASEAVRAQYYDVYSCVNLWFCVDVLWRHEYMIAWTVFCISFSLRMNKCVCYIQFFLQT